MTKRGDVIGWVLVIAAAGLGVWLGLTAIDVSPIFTEVPPARNDGPGR